MTNPTQARAEGRAEGIREAADMGFAHADGHTRAAVKRAILALLDAPAATQPAQVSVADAEMRSLSDTINALISQEPEPAPMTPVKDRGMHE